MAVQGLSTLSDRHRDLVVDSVRTDARETFDNVQVLVRSLKRSWESNWSYR